jgi:hypothetical protein
MLFIQIESELKCWLLTGDPSLVHQLEYGLEQPAPVTVTAFVITCYITNNCLCDDDKNVLIMYLFYRGPRIYVIRQLRAEVRRSLQYFFKYNVPTIHVQ